MRARMGRALAVCVEQGGRGAVAFQERDAASVGEDSHAVANLLGNEGEVLRRDMRRARRVARWRRVRRRPVRRPFPLRAGWWDQAQGGEMRRGENHPIAQVRLSGSGQTTRIARVAHPEAHAAPVPPRQPRPHRKRAPVGTIERYHGQGRDDGDGLGQP